MPQALFRVMLVAGFGSVFFQVARVPPNGQVCVVGLLWAVPKCGLCRTPIASLGCKAEESPSKTNVTLAKESRMRVCLVLRYMPFFLRFYKGNRKFNTTILRGSPLERPFFAGLKGDQKERHHSEGSPSKKKEKKEQNHMHSWISGVLQRGGAVRLEGWAGTGLCRRGAGLAR